MSCENVQERISLLLDGRMPEAEQENVLAHTGVCRKCDAHLSSLRAQRVALRKLAQTPMPEELATRLSVLASHERERQLTRVSVQARLRRLAANVNLAFDNLMRPVALPLTGGLLSTLVLFGLMVPKLTFSHQTGGNEFFSAPQGYIVTNPWEQGADDDARDFPVFSSPNQPKSDYMNIVNFTIDESGRVVDWNVVRGQVTDEMKSIILYSRFVPATTFGLPTSGTIQVRQSLPPCKYTSCSATVRG